MADIQRYFEQLHNEIRIDYDISAELRDKRDKVLKKIESHLSKNKRPSFDALLQGSYKMKTGVKPIADLEYDLDIGLRFKVERSDYTAGEIRGWVWDAIKSHTMSVVSKGPCLRVNYAKGFHLDLVVYAVEQDSKFWLAHKQRGWLPSDPPALLGYINDFRKTNFANTEDSTSKTDQFRRCVRYLRRWSDIRILREDSNKPTGLAIVLLAIQYGLRRASFLDERSDDRKTLEDFTKKLSQVSGRLTASKPTPEYEELLEGLSESAMQDLKDDLETLAGLLKRAGEAIDPVEACKILNPVLGMPIPPPEDTGKQSDGPAIITSSRSSGARRH